MSETPLAYLTIAELARRIRKGALSPVSLVQDLLERIQDLDPKLGAFVEVTSERALAEAKAAELTLGAGQDRGPLQGIPYVAKDLFDVRGAPTRAGSRLLSGNVAQSDCAVVGRLAEAGMVLLGKTHTVQFAFGGVGINHDQGTPHNPWHRVPHVPGGSSSGTAVAVASGLAPVGLGTDTGGSVRIPAALCGIVGLKTTVGRVSRAGVYPLSWALDSVGPLARSVEDVALLYRAIQGPDPEDGATLGVGVQDPLPDLRAGVRGVRVGIGETLFFDEADPEVDAAVREAASVLASLGARVESVEVPEVAQVWADPRRPLMVAAEACAINARWLDEHFDELDPVVANRMAGGKALSAADYVAVNRAWERARRSVLVTLRDVDALVVPATPWPARPVEEADASPEVYAAHNARYLRNTTVGNVLNLCGVSVPCGFTREGLPIGLMVYAKPFHEAMALRVAQAYETATQWHRRRPDVSWAHPGGRA